MDGWYDVDRHLLYAQHSHTINNGYTNGCSAPHRPGIRKIDWCFVVMVMMVVMCMKAVEVDMAEGFATVEAHNELTVELLRVARN